MTVNDDCHLSADWICVCVSPKVCSKAPHKGPISQWQPGACTVGNRVRFSWNNVVLLCSSIGFLFLTRPRLFPPFKHFIQQLAFQLCGCEMLLWKEDRNYLRFTKRCLSRWTKVEQIFSRKCQDGLNLGSWSSLFCKTADFAIETPINMPVVTFQGLKTDCLLEKPIHTLTRPFNAILLQYFHLVSVISSLYHRLISCLFVISVQLRPSVKHYKVVNEGWADKTLTITRRQFLKIAPDLTLKWETICLEGVVHPTSCVVIYLFFFFVFFVLRQIIYLHYTLFWYHLPLSYFPASL